MLKEENKKVKIGIIGAGLAGCEAALLLARCNYEVTIFEQKPHHFSSCHTSSDYAELVCSNSLRSKNITNGAGLLKEELALLRSPLIEIAYQCEIPTGDSLVVDRNTFSKLITLKVNNSPNIKVIHKQINELSKELIKEFDYFLIAAGPATSNEFFNNLCSFINAKNKYFIDGSAPLVYADSINYEKTFWQNRFDIETPKKYLNCPLSYEEYLTFYETIKKYTGDVDYLKDPVFQGCMPIEVIAQSGLNSLRFGPFKPIGLGKHLKNKPYAVVQLRQDDSYDTLYNLVGFQTGLGEVAQRAIIHLIPGLENVKIAKYGRLHHSLYVDSPRLLSGHYALKQRTEMYIIGQINGIEGYIEAISSGHLAALDIIAKEKQIPFKMPCETILGALCKYATSYAGERYIPIKSNFGILPPLVETIRDKAKRKSMLVERSINAIKEIVNKFYGTNN